MNDQTPMPFGTHKDTPLGQVPAGYLDWLIGQPGIRKYPDLERYIEDNLEAIHAEIEDDDG